MAKATHAECRKSSGFGGQGLGQMKAHKSKLQREQDAWAKAVISLAASEALSNSMGFVPLGICILTTVKHTALHTFRHLMCTCCMQACVSVTGTDDVVCTCMANR